MNISFQEVMMFDYFITVGTLIGFYSKALHLIRFLDVASELNSCFFLSSSVSSLCVFLIHLKEIQYPPGKAGRGSNKTAYKKQLKHPMI